MTLNRAMDAEAENRTEAASVFNALREIEGVDDKLLKRPELAHLPSVLEKDELPGCIASFNPVGIAVATDRRIISIRKSRWGSSIKSVDSYPYTDIHSIEAGESMWELPLGVQIISSGKRVRIDADKDWRFRFAEYVTARLSSNPVVETLQELEGVDEDLLKRPEVAHLASVLEEDEMLGCIASNALAVNFATNKRIINIEKSMTSTSIKKVDYYLYDDIQRISIEGTNELSIMVSGKHVTLDANGERHSGFVEYVNARISPNPFIAALRKLKGVDENLLKRPEVAILPSVLEKDEQPGFVATNRGSAVIVATDRRIVDIQQALWDASIKKIDSYPYDQILSINAGRPKRIGAAFTQGGPGLSVMQAEPALSLILVTGKTVEIDADEKSRYAFASYVTAKLNSLA